MEIKLYRISPVCAFAPNLDRQYSRDISICSEAAELIFGKDISNVLAGTLSVRFDNPRKRGFRKVNAVCGIFQTWRVENRIVMTGTAKALSAAFPSARCGDSFSIWLKFTPDAV